MTASGVDASSRASSKDGKGLLRLGGVLAFLGFSAYALMFAGFAYEDRSILEALGAVGWGLVALAVLLGTVAVTRRGNRAS